MPCYNPKCPCNADKKPVAEEVCDALPPVHNIESFTGQSLMEAQSKLGDSLFIHGLTGEAFAYRITVEVWTRPKEVT
jgi:hypothetical protein